MKETVYLRQVRSYVRRQARFSAGQKLALEKYWPYYGLECKPQLLNYQQCFGRQMPTVLEIGFGMGSSLLEMAKAMPEKNFIGVEVHRPGVATLLRNIEQQQLTNIRIYKSDANDVLEQCIADQSLAEVLLYFPDPWPKKRHHKRRIVQPEFINLVQRKLRVGGVFHMATDWQNYAEHMLELMSQTIGFSNQAGVGRYAERPAYRPLTKFETRGQKLGHEVWDLLFIKNTAEEL